MFNRVFLIVMDSVGIGAMEDANKFGDEGANTLLHAIGKDYNLNVLRKLGLTTLIGYEEEDTRGMYMRCKTFNPNKDSLNGHYEIMAGLLDNSYKTYPDGFPQDLIDEIEGFLRTKTLGNVPEDGVKIINDLGDKHVKTGYPIIYTSADSVLQVSAHEDVIPVDILYEMCEGIKTIVSKKEYRIARVIARPFIGKNGEYERTNKRRDFANDAPINVLDVLHKCNIKTTCIGKIGDLFNDRGIDVSIKTSNNIDGMMKLIDFAKSDIDGLIFANLNDFDSEYGHRRDREGYLDCLEEFNYYLPILLSKLKKDDLLIITADHGCDPTYKGTDHTREYVPILIYNTRFKKGKLMRHRDTLADIGATILDCFNIRNPFDIGKSIFDDLKN